MLLYYNVREHKSNKNTAVRCFTISQPLFAIIDHFIQDTSTFRLTVSSGSAGAASTFLRQIRYRVAFNTPRINIVIGLFIFVKFVAAIVAIQTSELLTIYARRKVYWGVAWAVDIVSIVSFSNLTFVSKRVKGKILKTALSLAKAPRWQKCLSQVTREANATETHLLTNTIQKEMKRMTHLDVCRRDKSCKHQDHVSASHEHHGQVFVICTYSMIHTTK